MPDARYTIFVPSQDGLGNPLTNIANYALDHLAQTIRGMDTWIEPGKQGAGGSSFDHLVAVGPEIPETDSHVKQLAAYIGEVANVPYVTAMKESKNGPVRWPVGNPEFRPGQPAESLALLA